MYTVTEDVIEGYTASIDGYHITNTYGLMDFTVTKVWKGRSNNEDIELILYANGVKLNSQPAYDRSGDVYTWKNLAKRDAAGKEIVYSAVEVPMADYKVSYFNANGATDAAYNGGTIVNSEMVSVSVRKVWNGLTNSAEKPEIELTLYCNGKPVNIAQPQPNQDGWYTYTNLPAVVNGRNAVYTVKETPVPGFEVRYVNANGAVDAAYDGGTIYNSVISDIPATGDDFPLIFCIAAMLLSLAGLAVFRKRGIMMR